MTLALAVGLGAALGAVARYVVDQVVQSLHASSFPFGTLLVNVTGSFLLGLLTGLYLHHGLAQPVKLTLGTGVLGGYTTFSTWGWETMALTQDAALAEATLNVVASVLAGLAAAAVGLGLALTL
jgi:CrcB protein